MLVPLLCVSACGHHSFNNIIISEEEEEEYPSIERTKDDDLSRDLNEFHQQKPKKKQQNSLHNVNGK